MSFMMEGLSLKGYYKCYLVDDTADITSKSFKVYIPTLMGQSQNKFGTGSEKPLSINKQLMRNDAPVNSTIQSQNFIVAKAMTDYRSEHFGQVFETSGVEHTSEETVVEEQPAGPGPHKHPHIPHVHKLKKPIEIYDMKYEELNNVIINKGHEMIGAFIDGNMNDFRIVHIVGVIPQNRA